ncbi:MAG TPA: elongation factor G [Candidatus Paceibacterota bacterium]|nr:elongation factor G [Verrucomicrobiota bacterium]HRZ44255.1 elongation factor G [Candidatus Paceibacterota bacterium]HRZ93963.1 elongation factor G [Candidatus Paceibacterota bacterium]
MKKYDAQSIRNLCFVSHGGVGKTSLAEALCFTTKGFPRLGKTANGTSTFDHRADEKERRMTISMHPGFCEWKETKINFLDTPGFLDLAGDIHAAVRVVESAVVLVDAASGIQVGTECALRIVSGANLPHLFLINGLDKDGADFEAALSALKEQFKTAIAPVHLPIGKGAGFKGIVDLITLEAFEYAREGSGIGQKIEVPAGLADSIKTHRLALMESVAETDETLMNAYFDKGELSVDELRQGLAAGLARNSLYPVLCASAALNMGTDLLLDAMVQFSPPAASRKEIQALEGQAQKPVACSPAAPMTALVFKTISEEHIGEFNLVRVFSGRLALGTEVQNNTRNISEKPMNLYLLRGHDRTEAGELVAGDIGALLKLKGTHTSDTLADRGQNLLLPPIAFPEPLVSIAIHPKTKGDEDKIGLGLAKLREEDPSFTFKYHPDIRQELISAMGDVHIDMVLDNLKSRFKVEVDRTPPRISYRETVTRSVQYVEYAHKKQTGGAGQYAKVAIDLEPLPRGSGYEFVDKIVGGVIDQPFRPAVDKGARAKMETGILAGYPIVDVRVLLVDGKTHPVDSKDIAFQIAGREVFKLAFEKAGPILLEPIVDLRVTVPDKNTGDVMGDLSSRRGKISGMEPGVSYQTIVAKVPEAEIQNYSQALRSITQGRGFYTKSFSHYDPVPHELARKIIEASKKELKEETE